MVSAEKNHYKAPTALVIKVTTSSCILQASIPGYGDAINLEPMNTDNNKPEYFGGF